MSRKFILAGALFSLAACEAGETDTNPSAVGCEVALAYAEEFVREIRAIDDLASRRIALSPSAGLTVTTQEQLDMLEAQDPNIVNDPEYELVAAAVRHRELNVLNLCPSLRKWVERENVLTDKDEIARLTRPEEWTIVVLTLSMPVITSDSRKALVYTADYAGGLAGATFAVTYERDDGGNWQVTDKQMLSIS